MHWTHSLYQLYATPWSLHTPYRWDYDNKNYLDAMDQLMGIQQDDRIRSIGLTNFDTKHLSELLEEGAPIVSNQACPPPPSIHLSSTPSAFSVM